VKLKVKIKKSKMKLPFLTFDFLILTYYRCFKKITPDSRLLTPD
jgi:hypothetical protein